VVISTWAGSTRPGQHGRHRLAQRRVAFARGILQRAAAVARSTVSQAARKASTGKVCGDGRPPAKLMMPAAR
jgi:hypothetical protein